MSLIEVISSQSRLNPAKVAVAFGDLSLTYSEFASLTARIAGNLRAAGAEPGDRVAVHLQNGLEASLAYIGCLKAGCVVVPINTRLKGREIDYILRHSGSAFYIGEPALYAAIQHSCPALNTLQRYLVSGSKTTHIRDFDELLGSNSVPLP